MKALLLLLAAGVSIANINSAKACSYYIDQVKKTAELEKVALATLEGSTILSSTVNSFSFFESKPTPMCPEELTYNATFAVNYNDGLNNCIAELKIKKVESWSALDEDNYTVSGRKAALCKKP